MTSDMRNKANNCYIFRIKKSVLVPVLLLVYSWGGFLRRGYRISSRPPSTGTSPWCCHLVRSGCTFCECGKIKTHTVWNYWTNEQSLSINRQIHDILSDPRNPQTLHDHKIILIPQLIFSAIKINYKYILHFSDLFTKDSIFFVFDLIRTFFNAAYPILYTTYLSPAVRILCVTQNGELKVRFIFTGNEKQLLITIICKEKIAIYNT